MGCGNSAMIGHAPVPMPPASNYNPQAAHPFHVTVDRTTPQVGLRVLVDDKGKIVRYVEPEGAAAFMAAEMPPSSVSAGMRRSTVTGGHHHHYPPITVRASDPLPRQNRSSFKLTYTVAPIPKPNMPEAWKDQANGAPPPPPIAVDDPAGHRIAIGLLPYLPPGPATDQFALAHSPSALGGFCLFTCRRNATTKKHGGMESASIAAVQDAHADEREAKLRNKTAAAANTGAAAIITAMDEEVLGIGQHGRQYSSDDEEGMFGLVSGGLNDGRASQNGARPNSAEKALGKANDKNRDSSYHAPHAAQFCGSYWGCERWTFEAVDGAGIAVVQEELKNQEPWRKHVRDLMDPQHRVAPPALLPGASIEVDVDLVASTIRIASRGVSVAGRFTIPLPPGALLYPCVTLYGPGQTVKFE
jgi:hypothetical protein